MGHVEFLLIPTTTLVTHCIYLIYHLKRAVILTASLIISMIKAAANTVWLIVVTELCHQAPVVEEACRTGWQFVLNNGWNVCNCWWCLHALYYSQVTTMSPLTTFSYFPSSVHQTVKTVGEGVSTAADDDFVCFFLLWYCIYMTMGPTIEILIDKFSF